MSGTEASDPRQRDQQEKERASGSSGEGRQEVKECSDGSDPMNDSAPSHNNTKVFGTPIRTDSKLASPFSPLHFIKGDTARNSSIFLAESPFPSFFQKRGFLSRAGDGTYSNSNTPLQMKNYQFHNDEDRSHNGDDASFNPVLNSPFLRRPGEEHYYEGHEKLNPVLFSPAIRDIRDSAILKGSSPHRDDQHSYHEIYHNHHRLSDIHRLEPQRLLSDPPHSPQREPALIYGFSPKYPRPNSFRKLNFEPDSKNKSPYPVAGCITPQFVVDDFRPIAYMEEYHYRYAPPMYHPDQYHPEVEDIGRSNLIRIKHPDAEKTEDETFSRIVPKHATTSKKSQKRKVVSHTNSDSKMKHHHPFHVNLRDYARLPEIPQNSEMYPHPQLYYNTRSVSFGGIEEGQEGYGPNPVHDRENRYMVYETQGYEEGGVVNQRTAYRERTETKRTPHQRYDPNDLERREILIMSTTNRKSPNRNSMSGSKKHVKQIDDQKQEEEVQQPHKPCSCSKSKCLKLYCECFAAGHHCGKDCNCTVCMNKPEFEDKRQEAIKNTQDRNSHAFKPKIGVSKDTGAQHLKGCTCKKSHCIKNYCECYQNGVACGEQCKCICCKNSIQDRMMRSQTVLNSSEKMRRSQTHDSARKVADKRGAEKATDKCTFGNASENSSPLNLPSKHLGANVSHFGGQKGESVTTNDLTPSPFKNPEKLWSSEKCPENQEEPQDFVVKVKKLPSELKLVGSKRSGSDILKSVGDDNKEPSLTKKKKAVKAGKLRKPLLNKEVQFLEEKVKEVVVSSIKSTEAKKNKRMSRKEEQPARKKSERIHKQRAE